MVTGLGYVGVKIWNQHLLLLNSSHFLKIRVKTIFTATPKLRPNPPSTWRISLLLKPLVVMCRALWCDQNALPSSQELSFIYFSLVKPNTNRSMVPYRLTWRGMYEDLQLKQVLSFNLSNCLSPWKTSVMAPPKWFALKRNIARERILKTLAYRSRRVIPINSSFFLMFPESQKRRAGQRPPERTIQGGKSMEETNT